MVDEGIQLRREVYREDLKKMIHWMQDDQVTAYLNEDQNIDDQLQRLVRESTLPIFSPQLSRDGCFFMISLADGTPIGFLKLVSKGEKAEIVIVIGERKQWGKGLGFRAVQKGLRHAFFEWRKQKVIAKIHKQNTRSKKIFRKAGLSKEEDLPREEKFTIDLQQMIRHATAAAGAGRGA